MLAVQPFVITGTLSEKKQHLKKNEQVNVILSFFRTVACNG